jgi:hypothetical protein
MLLQWLHSGPYSYQLAPKCRRGSCEYSEMPSTAATVSSADAWKHKDVVEIMEKAAAAAAKLKDSKHKRAKYNAALDEVRQKLESLQIDIPRAIKKVCLQAMLWLGPLINSFCSWYVGS